LDQAFAEELGKQAAQREKEEWRKERASLVGTAKTLAQLAGKYKEELERKDALLASAEQEKQRLREELERLGKQLEEQKGQLEMESMSLKLGNGEV